MASEKKNEADGFDVVFVRGKTPDGEGASVVRARPGKLESGEMRPLRDGQPIAGGEVVSLSPRTDVPNAYDVKTEYTTPAAERATSGPAQVATEAYRESWERTFGPRSKMLS